MVRNNQILCQVDGPNVTGNWRYDDFDLWGVDSDKATPVYDSGDDMYYWGNACQRGEWYDVCQFMVPQNNIAQEEFDRVQALADALQGNQNEQEAGLNDLDNRLGIVEAINPDQQGNVDDVIAVANANLADINEWDGQLNDLEERVAANERELANNMECEAGHCKVVYDVINI